LFVTDIRVEQSFFNSEGCAIESAPPVKDFSIAGDAGSHDGVVVIVEVEIPGESELLEVAEGLGGFRGSLGLGKHGKDDGGEDRDDGDDDEKFDKRERFLCFHKF